MKQKRGENIERFDEIDHEGSYVGQCGIILVAAPIVFIWMVLVFYFGFPSLCARSRQKNDQIQGIMFGGGRGSASLV